MVKIVEFLGVWARSEKSGIASRMDNHDPRPFSAWAPVALAAIGRLPGTVENRSVIIRLRRRRPDEFVEELRLDRAGGLEKLARMAARCAADNATTLQTAVALVHEVRSEAVWIICGP